MKQRTEKEIVYWNPLWDQTHCIDGTKSSAPFLVVNSVILHSPEFLPPLSLTSGCLPILPVHCQRLGAGAPYRLEMPAIWFSLFFPKVT